MTLGQDPSQDDNTCEALPLDCALRQVYGQPSPPQPPGPVLRWAWRMVVVSAITLPGTFLGKDTLFVLSPMAGTCFALIAMICSIIAAGRNTSGRLAATDRVRPLRILVTFLVCLLALLGQGTLASKTLNRVRDVGKSSVTAANLRGIGQAISIYRDDAGVFPPALNDLVATNNVTAMQCCSPNDPGFWMGARTKPLYSSFVYHPGTVQSFDNSDLVVAFEKKPWTPKELRLFPTYGRCVLFGDGHVLAIDEMEFHARLEKDKACRLMLGWPVFPLDDDNKAH
jgi:hypothetical protein